MCTDAPLNRQIALIDPTVEAWECLASGVKDGVEVVLLDPAQDAIAQITHELSKRPNTETLHLISHGAPGTLLLGQTIVDSDKLYEVRFYRPILRIMLATNEIGSVLECAPA